MTIPVFPTPFDANELEITSRAILHWRASDLSKDTIDGMVGTYTRNSILIETKDTVGSVQGVKMGYSQLPWDSASWAGVNRVGLRFNNYASLTWPVEIKPVVMAWLIEYVQIGAMENGNALWSLCNTIVDGGILLVNVNAGVWRFRHDTDYFGAVDVSMGTAPSDGDYVTLRGQLYADGSVQMWQSINGAAETTSGRSGANSFGANWGTAANKARVAFNDYGGFGHGNIWLRRFKIVHGTPDYQTLARIF